MSIGSNNSTVMEIYGRWGFRATEKTTTVFELLEAGDERIIATAGGDSTARKEANARVAATALYVADESLKASARKTQ